MPDSAVLVAVVVPMVEIEDPPAYSVVERSWMMMMMTLPLIQQVRALAEHLPAAVVVSFALFSGINLHSLLRNGVVWRTHQSSFFAAVVVRAEIVLMMTNMTDKLKKK